MRPLRALPGLLALALAVAAAACAPSASPAPSGPASPASTGAVPAATATSAATGEPPPAATAAPASGIACTAPAAPTLAQTEGPYYRAGAPETADLATPDLPGTRITLTGHVVDPSCAPIAGVVIDAWQADANGAYDNAGYTLRGVVRTDADGRYVIRTVVPGQYPGRTEHIHLKLTPPGGATLTTQLYFPGSTANDEDGIFDPGLVLAIEEDGDALVGTFTFVLAP